MYSLMHIVSSASVKRKYLFQASRPKKIDLDSRTKTELPPYYERGVWAGGVSYVGADVSKLPSVILSKSKLDEAKVLLAGLLVSQENYDQAEELYQVFMLYNFERMMPDVFCESERAWYENIRKLYLYLISSFCISFDRFFFYTLMTQDVLSRDPLHTRGLAGYGILLANLREYHFADQAMNCACIAILYVYLYIYMAHLMFLCRTL